MEQKKVQKCAWCGMTENLQFATKRPPWRYFCNDSCLRKWEWFNRNGQTGWNVKETNDGEKKN